MCSLKSVNTGKWLCPSHFSPRGEFNHTALTLCFYCTGRGHFDCISFRTTNNVYVLSTAFIRIPPAPPQKKKKQPTTHKKNPKEPTCRQNICWHEFLKWNISKLRCCTCENCNTGLLGEHQLFHGNTFCCVKHDYCCSMTTVALRGAILKLSLQEIAYF